VQSAICRKTRCIRSVLAVFCHTHFIGCDVAAVKIRSVGGGSMATPENPQERLITIGWVVGFVDGEGCFSCSIYQNHKMTLKWQVRPAFDVVQGESSRAVLEVCERSLDAERSTSIEDAITTRKTCCVTTSIDSRISAQRSFRSSTKTHFEPRSNRTSRSSSGSSN
jgi:hypothetical protein